jgi:hypothetical protein
MKQNVTLHSLVDVAAGNRRESLTLAADPTDRRLPFRFAEALAEPMSIEAVERLEGAAKALFRPVLASSRRVPVDLAVAFVEFFHTVGFLFKYKPYGVKVASPFGYSIFDLHDGQGFSFQLHKEPKLEAFHILAGKSESFVYLSTYPEWRREGSRAARRWAEGARMESRHSYAPSPGDVIRVSSTALVHSVVGCTLEEYASCSVDAVERLFDQNAGRSWSLPSVHPNIALLLDGLYADLPARLVEHGRCGSPREPVEGEPILALKGQFRGLRAWSRPGHPVVVPPVPQWLSVVVPVHGSVRCQTAGRTWSVGPGELLATAPGYGVEISSDEPAVFALHSVIRDLVLREWSR